MLYICAGNIQSILSKYKTNLIDMQVQKKIFNIWSKHYNYGDLDIMASHTGLSKFTISRVMNSGRCEQSTFDKLSEYFIYKVQQDKEKNKVVLSKLESTDQD